MYLPFEYVDIAKKVLLFDTKFIFYPIYPVFPPYLPAFLLFYDLAPFYAIWFWNLNFGDMSQLHVQVFNFFHPKHLVSDFWTLYFLNISLFFYFPQIYQILEICPFGW